jgi:hypothetical protein
MSNYGQPTVGDIETAVAALKSEAQRALTGPWAVDYDRMMSLNRVASALESLLPRTQTVSIKRLEPAG